MDWTQLISSLGFPIACCAALMWWVKYTTDRNDEKIKNIQEANASERKQYLEKMEEMSIALNNNTAAMNNLILVVNSLKGAENED